MKDKEEISSENDEEDKLDDSELRNNPSYVAGVAQALVNDVTELIKNPGNIEVKQLIKLNVSFLRRAGYTFDDIHSMIYPFKGRDGTADLYIEVINSWQF
jgi:hypothetical protein